MSAMLSSLLYSILFGGLALALSIGVWTIFTKDAEKLKQEGKQSVGSGFSSKAIDVVFKIAVAVVFLAGVSMIASGIWQFAAFPR